MEVIHYLSNHTYEDLTNEFGIKVNEYDDRVVLNYSQIDSPKFNPIVAECRGLILSKPDHKVLCRSFDRFYNYNEDPNTNKFVIEKSIVEEKIDGSLCNVYHDGNVWQIATRGMAFAEGGTPSGRTFREIFVETLGGEPNDVFKHIDKTIVVIFELVSPETRVVKPYEEACLYLLDVRARDTGTFYGQEFTWFWNIPKGVKWKYPEKYTFESWDDCFFAAKKLPAMDEGYVVKTNLNWRLKVKNPAYLAIANMRMNGIINEKRIVLLVLMNDYEEYLGYFPEDQKEFDPYIQAYETMIADIDEHWVKYKDIEDQKEFAMAIKDCHSKHILFGMRKKQYPQEIIENMTDNAKVKLLKGYVGRKGDDICSRM